MRLKMNAPPAGQADGGTREHRQALAGEYSAPDVHAIADELGGRKAGPGRFAVRCPVHDDRSPSAVVHDTGDGVVVHCYAGCISHEIISELRARGLWPQPRQRTKSGPSLRELCWEAIRHDVAGTVPDRVPPFTRNLPRRGEVRILTGGDTWSAAKVLPAIIVPPGHPPGAYRWPVRSRKAAIIDLADAPTRLAGYDHPPGRRLAEDWTQCPICWAANQRVYLRGFAHLLIERHGAVSVRVVSGADRATYQREVRHAA